MNGWISHDERAGGSVEVLHPPRLHPDLDISALIAEELDLLDILRLRL